MTPHLQLVDAPVRPRQRRGAAGPALAWALNGLGEAARNPAEAVTHHTAALAVATAIGDRGRQARAHAGHGDYEQALVIYTDLGMPQAEEMGALLSNVPCPPATP